MMLASESNSEVTTKVRCSAQGGSPMVLTDIYQQEVNIAIWQRTLSQSLQREVDEFLRVYPNFQKSLVLSPHQASAELYKVIDEVKCDELIENITELIDMFCCLFELEQAGVRITVLNKAMCPRFHVDQVPCRLVSTYSGVCTEWLEHRDVNYDVLGHRSAGVPDVSSGLYGDESCIQQLGSGDVALLKGERWMDNEGAGLVHRSPQVAGEQARLLITLDFH
ncbi:DUF1826 domain-containing protein [Vibrio sp. SCSIO 43136]|uniref:DUF1826 domain-containing protein n=1 Tax=Vibrio sp. SCSIO 43136 TaxID=2819101 RepID=UPI00207573E8|nr:DUF1826 domain-containing protein [Vibrio sp. SCSIO 43136]USD67202.1 DUF1826 domain-containing protein [Vibrio sp. SCSIO 43136]